MPRNLSFKEALAQPRKTKERFRDPSAFPVEIKIRLNGDFVRPIDLAYCLMDAGLNLYEAHDALNILVEKQVYEGVVHTTDFKKLAGDIAALNLLVESKRVQSVA